jgi:integrase/recombinase XerD
VSTLPATRDWCAGAPIQIALPPLAQHAEPFLRWFALVRRRAPNTVASYGHDLTAFLAFAAEGGLTSPEAVTFRHVETYVAWLQATRGLKATSVNRHVHSLRAFWRWLVREGLTPTNVAAEVFLLPQPKRLPRYLPVPDQETLLAALARDPSPLGLRDYALMATGLLTGLRCAELSHLQLGHLNLAGGVLQVIAGKGGKDREAVVVPRLAGILARYLAIRPNLVRGPNPYVFVRAAKRRGWTTKYGSEPVGPKTLYYTIRRHVRAVLHRDASPHTLRHSFATRLRANGGDLQLIQEALGHASITTTVMYAHITTPQRRSDLARLLGEA